MAGRYGLHSAPMEMLSRHATTEFETKLRRKRQLEGIATAKVEGVCRGAGPPR
jgi:hypothetical protein